VRLGTRKKTGNNEDHAAEAPAARPRPRRSRDDGRIPLPRGERTTHRWAILNLDVDSLSTALRAVSSGPARMTSPCPAPS